MSPLPFPVSGWTLWFDYKSNGSWSWNLSKCWTYLRGVCVCVGARGVVLKGQRSSLLDWVWLWGTLHGAGPLLTSNIRQRRPAETFKDCTPRFNYYITQLSGGQDSCEDTVSGLNRATANKSSVWTSESAIFPDIQLWCAPDSASLDGFIRATGNSSLGNILLLHPYRISLWQSQTLGLSLICWFITQTAVGKELI